MLAFILHNRNPNTKRPSSIGFYAGFIRQFRRAALRSAGGGQAKSAAVLVGAPPAIGAFSDGSHPVPPSLSNERRMYHSSLHALGLIAPGMGEKIAKGRFLERRERSERRDSSAIGVRACPRWDFCEFLGGRGGKPATGDWRRSARLWILDFAGARGNAGMNRARDARIPVFAGGAGKMACVGACPRPKRFDCDSRACASLSESGFTGL